MVCNTILHSHKVEPCAVSIQDHTSAIKGNAARAEMRSLFRANLVANAISRFLRVDEVKAGLEPACLQPIGFGARRPLASFVNDGSHPENQRIEVHLTSPGVLLLDEVKGKLSAAVGQG